MSQSEPLTAEVREAENLKADIVVGIPSYNNSRTIGNVVRAVEIGLGKHFPGLKSIIINSDGGSSDGTTKEALEASVDHRALFLPHKLEAAHRMSATYHGIAGKGSAVRAICRTAVDAGARACCIVDADLRSITPEWVELLLSPVMRGGFDFVAPLYARHKYDGTITNSIIYPLTRALYGKKIRQPIGGEFGFSGKMAELYLSQDVWESDIARYGIDIWMTTEAIASGLPVCQSYLGAKIHDPKDPGADLRDMFVQVVGSLFGLTEKHYDLWKDAKAASDVPTFGFRYMAGVVPIGVNTERMIGIFREGVASLMDVWGILLAPETLRKLTEASSAGPANFHIPDEAWVRVVYDFAAAHHHRKIQTEHLLKSLIPLYYGKTASFIIQTAQSTDEEAERAIEEVCLEFERQKGYFLERWQEVSR